MTTNSVDVIDNDLLSQDAFKQYLINYVKTRPNSQRWLDFYESGSGLIFLELIAALGVFKAFHEIVRRRESYLEDAQVITSGRAIAEALGHSVNRGQNIHVTLTVVPTSTVVISAFSIIGTYQGYDIINVEDIALTSGVSQDIEVVIGDLTQEDQNYISAEPSVLRFESEDITEDYRLLLDNNEVEFSDIATDLQNNKFVVLTNSAGSVDVFYLNREVKEQTDITCKAASTLSGGEYFLINSPLTNYYVYFVISGSGSDPSISGRTGIEVVLLSTDTDEEVATKVAAALDGVSSFTADSQSTKVSVEATTVGDVNNAADVDTGFIINVVTDGISENYIYTTGSTLTVEYVASNSLSSFDYSSVTFNYGSVSAGYISSDLQSSEDMNLIKVNAPYFHATQKLIRARDDYKKVFKTLDSNLADVNARDFSTAVVQLSYVKSDESYYSETQRAALKNELESYRAFGVSPLKGIENPVRVELDLDIIIQSSSSVTALQVTSDVTQIKSNYEKVLGASLDLASIEEDIEELSYVKIARIYPDTTNWDYNTGYEFKEFIQSEDYDELIYENDIIYKSGTWLYETGFTFYSEADGSATVAESTYISIPSNVSLSGGEYFTINTPSTSYYVWYDIDNASTDPNPNGKTEIEVDILSTDTASLIAAKTKTALDAVGVFTTTLVTSTSLRVTNIALGAAGDTQDGPGEPTWSEVIGTQIVDNRLVWECKQSSETFNLPELEMEFREITSDDITNKRLILNKIPNDPSDVLLIPIGGSVQEYGVDYAVSGTDNRLLTWDGYDLESDIEAGDEFQIMYSVYKDAVTSYKHTTYTITSQHISDKGFTLSYEPFERNDVLLYVVGGTVQEYGTDFIISGSSNTFLSWNGLGLDGTLAAGDQVTVYYLIKRDYGQYQLDTVYSIGDQVLPLNISSTKIYECVGYVNKSGTTEPIWSTTVGTYINDNEVIWKVLDYDSSVTNEWDPSTRYNTGDKISPSDSSGVTGITLVCTGYRGFSSSTIEPTWPLVAGQYVDDNELRWTCRDKNDDPLSETVLAWNQFYAITFSVTVE